MIGIVDVKLQSHNPNFPLEPVFTFINSDSSFRVRNVPKQIGQWKITKVFVNLSYPDNTVVSKECVLNGGIWVGTVTGCSISGSVEQGFTVTAQGINEDGETLSNYVLGAGDIYVKDIDGSISPGSSAARMFYYEEVPADAKEGDTAFINGILNIYNGTQWVLCYNAVPTYIEDNRGNKIEADLDVTINTNEYAPWYLNSFRETEYDPPIQLDYKEVQFNNVTVKVWISDSLVQNIDGGNYYVAISSDCQIVYMLEEVEEDVYSIHTMYHTNIVYISVLQINSLESGTIPVDFTRNSVYIMDTSKLVTQNELNDEIERITDEIPTKTSDLTNDSGFITSGDLRYDLYEVPVNLQLKDRAINFKSAVGVATSFQFVIPSATSATKCRDFLLLFNIFSTSTVIPTVSFIGATDFYIDGDTFPAPDSTGAWLYSFTEIFTNNFAVSLKKLTKAT